MTDTEALEEIYKTMCWIEAHYKSMENDMQSNVLYGLALGYIGGVLSKIGYDISKGAST